MFFKFSFLLVSFYTTIISYLLTIKYLPNKIKSKKRNHKCYELVKVFPLFIDFLFISILVFFVSDLDYLKKNGLQDEDLSILYIFITLYTIYGILELFASRKQRIYFYNLCLYDGYSVIIAAIAKSVLVFLLFYIPFKINGLNMLTILISSIFSVLLIYSILFFYLTNNKKFIKLCLYLDLISFIGIIILNILNPINFVFFICLFIEFIGYVIYIIYLKSFK